jgi:hypothetical protein
MASGDRPWPQPPWPGAVWSDALGWVPGPVTYAATWFGGEYPGGRGKVTPVSGWQCPGCSRCFSPTVRECSHCGPTLRDRIASAGNACHPPREGGTCSCEEGG